MKATIIAAAGRGRLFNYRDEILRLRDGLIEKLSRLIESKPVWMNRMLEDEIRLTILRLRPIYGATASNAFETDMLKLIFNATAIADLAQDDGSAPATNIAVALHTADPGEAGNQSTSEAAYTSYARVNVARTSGGWTVSGGTANPAANIDFPTSGAAGSTITHFSVGSGVANYMIASGSISPPIPVGAAGVTPRLTTATAVTID